MLLRSYLKTITLLCVESCDVLTTIYEDIFTILFKEVILTKNAEDAISIHSNKKIDIIITAQILPGMTGIDMIRLIRKTDKELPIIFVSSFEHVELLTEAIKLRVSNFVKKPFETTDILDAIEDATKQLLAKKYILQKQKEEMSALKEKIDYSDFQENLSFQKALKVIRNDFYYKQLSQSSDSITIIDFLYTARDVISGDTYSARAINKNQTLLILIDGMGKGLSASISALLAVSFLNKCVDINVEKNKILCLRNLTSKAIKHIKKILLDEEILSLSLVLIEIDTKVLEYVSFSMPPILLQNENDEISTLKSNNPPLSAYTQDFKIHKMPCIKIKKLLMYSDGLVENYIKDEDTTYAEYIQEDFKNSISREDFRKKIISKITKQEDDITFILLNQISLKNHVKSIKIDSKLDEIERANEWFDEIITKKTKNLSLQSHAALAFMELLMNAYEHGSLGMNGDTKHALIESDEYFNFIHEKDLECNKKISIDIYEFNNHLIVKIKDEGLGFDTKILSAIFGINKNFNRRGIFMSRNATLGIYYNNVANQITFIIKLND